MTTFQRLCFLIVLVGASFAMQERVRADICSEHPEATECYTWQDGYDSCAQRESNCQSTCSGEEYHFGCIGPDPPNDGFCYCTALGGGGCQDLFEYCDLGGQNDCCPGLDCDTEYHECIPMP